MEKTGRKALFQAAPSNNGNNDVNIILEDWANILKSAVEGDASASIDIDSVDGSLKSLGETLNSAIKKISEVELLKRQSESFIQQNPQAIAVLGPDKSRIDINKEYERVWRGSYEELMAKKLYDFDITMTGGADFYASYETKRLAVSDIEVKWPNGEYSYLRLYQVPILNNTGDIIVNYYIYQDLTKDVSVEKYLNSEVERLKVNLEMFARGDLKFNAVVDEGNEYTTVVRDDFALINGSIDGVRDAVASMLTDVGLLAEATVEGKLDTRVDASAHDGEFAQVIEGVNDTLDAVIGPLNVAAEYVDRISKGDIPEKVTDDMQGDFNEIKNNLNQCIDALNLVNEDVGLLVEAGTAGDLSVRADPARHQGVFADYIAGFNDTLDASGAPLGETVTLLERMAVNDYTKRIENEYPGDYARVTKNLNEVMGRLVHIQDTVQHIAAGDLSDLNDYKALGKRSDNDKLIPSFIGMIESLQAVVDDANMLAQAGVNGHLDVRADAKRHAGAYGEVIGGINDSLDAVIGPLNVAAEYVDRISKGDIPDKVTENMKGDFNEIKNNLNGCIDAINLLVEDAHQMAVAASEGRIDTRVDVSRHMGDYAKVMAGLNDSFEEIGHVLAVTANYIEAVAKGNEISKITKDTKGEYLVIRDNINDSIDVVNGVIGEINKLTEAAVNGQLDTRGNAAEFPGVWGVIIGGINDSLDAVIGPLNVAAEYIDRISKGDIPDKVTGDTKGDFNEIKNNLNECIDAINLLVVDTNVLVDAATAGRLTARADVSQHAGDFAKIVKGINQTLDVINKPFREMNAAIAQLDVTTNETTQGADEIAKAVEQVAVTGQLCADLGNSLITQIERVDRQVSDLSASNEEIASTSQEVHEHAVQTAEIGERAQKLGAEANAKMNVVEEIAKQSVDGIEHLNSRMQEIDNVVKQVNDITNQINLLALNAAIEAARAGEHGRGFAVVAGEVRNLAVEAKAATGQIDQVVAGVQAISAKTAEAMGSAHAEIGSGVASVNETIAALNEIVKGSQDMRVNIDEIAKAIEDQANMANHIVEAMEESSRLTRENQGQVEELASLAEEVSASTEEIGSSIHGVKDMAGDLRQTMDKFEV